MEYKYVVQKCRRETRQIYKYLKQRPIKSYDSKLIENGKVTVNGNISKASYKVNKMII